MKMQLYKTLALISLAFAIAATSLFAGEFSFTSDVVTLPGELDEEFVFTALITNESDAVNVIQVDLTSEDTPEEWYYFWCMGFICLPPNTYAFTDTLTPNMVDTLFVHFFPSDVSETGSLTYTLYSTDAPAETQALTFTVDFESAVDEDHGEISPVEFKLLNAYPNPFNSETVISFSQPKGAKVDLSVYDMTGRSVRKLVDGWQTAGTHRTVWNGADNRGYTQPAGIYLVKLNSDGQTSVSRVVKLD